MTREAEPQDETGLLGGLTDEEREVVARVVAILRRLRYGTVLLIVQDGKVVQIEMAEKFRLR
ncbi:MAG TPA: YezD family protein [Actinomycetota bacterium]|nr:YezD family protein [Actinomycetota bacterium]